VWLASQKSARTRFAYKKDVRHFTRVVGISRPEQLRQVDHGAVIAWEVHMRETEGLQSSVISRRLSALSSLFSHLVRHGTAVENPVREVVRPSINRQQGKTLAFSKRQPRAILNAPQPPSLTWLRDRAILAVGLQVGFRRAEIVCVTASPKLLRGLAASREVFSVRLPDSLGSLRLPVRVLFSAVSLYLIIIYLYILHRRGKM
jgi:site-specific recombinase XerD